jgi:hypothetical protein
LTLQSHAHKLNLSDAYVVPSDSQHIQRMIPNGVENVLRKADSAFGKVLIDSLCLRLNHSTQAVEKERQVHGRIVT